MSKTNIKVAKKKNIVEDKELQEVIKEWGLNNIGSMVCGELQNMGDFLSRDSHDTNARINILIDGSLDRLSLARTTLRFAQEEKTGDLDMYEINGIETAVNEVYAMLRAAMSLKCRRPIKSVEAV